MRRKEIFRSLLGVLAMLAIVGIGVTAFVLREQWLPWLSSEEPIAEEHQKPIEDAKVLKLSPQARKNLGLVSQPAVLQSYWRNLQVPGVIVDRPRLSDRGVTSPAVGVVTQVHAFAGDTVKPGEKLFTLRLFSEYLQNTQSELFKATRETELIQEEVARLDALARGGAIPGNRLIELDQRKRRQEGLLQAYRQDLLTRGLSPAQIEQIAQGTFVSTIDLVAPLPITGSGERTVQPVTFIQDERGAELGYEVQELKVELGQQVQAGQLLSVLSNHRLLYIEGHAFKQEAPSLEYAARNGLPIHVEFAEDDSQYWPPLKQTFQIRHLANTIEAASRTFDFFIPLTNQSRAYEQNGKTFVV